MHPLANDDINSSQLFWNLNTITINCNVINYLRMESAIISAFIHLNAVQQLFSLDYKSNDCSQWSQYATRTKRKEKKKEIHMIACIVYYHTYLVSYSFYLKDKKT